MPAHALRKFSSDARLPPLPASSILLSCSSLVVGDRRASAGHALRRMKAERVKERAPIALLLLTSYSVGCCQRQCSPESHQRLFVLGGNGVGLVLVFPRKLGKPVVPLCVLFLKAMGLETNNNR